MPGPDAAEAASPDDSDVSNFERPGGRIATGLRLLGLYTIVRLVLAVADVLAAHVSYGSNLAGPLLSWDSHWYLIVAAHGYPAVAPTVGGQLTYSAAGFLPVFPLLIRLFTTLGLPPVAAALAVSVIAGAMATLLVWRLATDACRRKDRLERRRALHVVPGHGRLVGAAVLRIRWPRTRSREPSAHGARAVALGRRRRGACDGDEPACPAARPGRGRARPAKSSQGASCEARGSLCSLFPPALSATSLLSGSTTTTSGSGGGSRRRLGEPRSTSAVRCSAFCLTFGDSVTRVPHGWSGWAWPPLWRWLLALWRAKLPGCINAYCIGVLVLLFASNSLGFKPRLLTWAFPAFIAVAAVLKQRTLARHRHHVRLPAPDRLPRLYLARQLHGPALRSCPSCHRPTCSLNGSAMTGGGTP